MNEIKLYREPVVLPSTALTRHNPQIASDALARAYASEVLPTRASPLSELLGALRRHKLAILMITFLGLLIGLGSALLQTPVYQARSALEVVGLNENLLGMKNFDPNGGVEYSTEAYIQTQIRILKSDSLLERVSTKLGFPDRPEFANAPTPRFAWRKALRLPDKTLSTRERILDTLRTRLRVEASGLTRILEITYDSSDPKEAADVLNTLAAEYIDQSLESRGKGTEATTDWLGRQLADIKQKLERSDDQLQAYARTTGLIYTSEKDNLAEDKLRQLQVQMSQAGAERVSKQAQYELATTSPAETLPEVLNDGSLRDYQLKLTELNRQLAELSSALTPEHYKVQRVQAQITELKTSLNQQRNNIVRRIRNEYEAAERRESLLKGRYAEQMQLVSNQAGKATRYNILKREVDSNRQMYDALLQKMKEATVASANRTSGVRVLDPASPPSVPYKPSLGVNGAVGLLSGFLMAVAIVVIIARNDNTVQLPRDVTSTMGIHELGLIPAGKGPNLGLTTWEHNLSPMAESFRSTVASMMFSDGSPPKVTVFTSANPGEGKSTVVSNVAIAWAQTRNRVLLIDGDMRRPVQHKIFGLSNRTGISDLLVGDEMIKESSLLACLQSTRVPNLSLLSAGGNPDVVNFLYSSRLHDLIAMCRRTFDIVLIDSPPMLQMPDARVLARLADGVILVVRSGQTARGAAILATQRLTEDGTPILGSILNSFDLGRTRDMYRGYQ